MLYLATHTVDVLTGTTTDELGDEVDGATVAASGVPVSIIERSRRVYRYDSTTPRTVRSCTGRAPAGTPVSQGDRLRDTGTGTTWMVDAVGQQTNPVIPADLDLELRRVDGT